MDITNGAVHEQRSLRRRATRREPVDDPREEWSSPTTEPSSGPPSSGPPSSGPPSSGPPSSWPPSSWPPNEPRTIQDVGRALALPSIWALILALIVGLVVAFLGADYERTRPAKYESDAVLLLDSPTALATDATAVNTISELRAKYIGLIGTNVIAGPASAALGLPESLVAGSVIGFYEPNSLDIILRAISFNPKQAQTLVTGVANALVDYVKSEQEALPPSVNEQVRLHLTLINTPYLGGRISPTHRKEITTGGVYGAVALAATYVVAQLVIDDRRRRRRLKAAQQT